MNNLQAQKVEEIKKLPDFKNLVASTRLLYEVDVRVNPHNYKNKNIIQKNDRHDMPFDRET